MGLDKNCNKTIIFNKDQYIRKHHHKFLLYEICNKVLANSRRSNANGLYDLAKSSQDEVRITEWENDYFWKYLVMVSKISISVNKMGKKVFFALFFLFLFFISILYFQYNKLPHEKEHTSDFCDGNYTQLQTMSYWGSNSLQLLYSASIFVLMTMMLPASQPHSTLIRPISTTQKCLIKNAPLTCSYSEEQLTRNSHKCCTDSFMEVDNGNPTINLVPYTVSESKVDSSWFMSSKTQSDITHVFSLSGHLHYKILHPTIRREVVNFGFAGTVVASIMLVFMSPLNFMATYVALLSYGKVYNKFLYKYTSLCGGEVLPIRIAIPSNLNKMCCFVNRLWIRQFSNSSGTRLDEEDSEFGDKTKSSLDLIQIVRTYLIMAYNWTGHVFKIPIPYQSLFDFLNEIINGTESHSIDHSDSTAVVSSSSDHISTQIQEQCGDSSQKRTETFRDERFNCHKLTSSNSQNVWTSEKDPMDLPMEKAIKTIEEQRHDCHHNQENFLCENISNSDHKVLPSQCSLEAMDWKHSSSLVQGRVNCYMYSRCRTTDDISSDNVTTSQDASDDLVLNEGASFLPNKDSEMFHENSTSTNIWTEACVNDDEEYYSPSKVMTKSFNSICCGDNMT